MCAGVSDEARMWTADADRAPDPTRTEATQHYTAAQWYVHVQNEKVGRGSR